MSQSLPKTLGMRHLALNSVKLDACAQFYVDLLGMEIEWQPDEDNIYLTSGSDNLALHRAPADFDAAKSSQRLDHLGFILSKPDDVDQYHAAFEAAGVDILAKPRTHRDGARSFYCKDPDGNVVQLIYHPPISG